MAAADQTERLERELMAEETEHPPQPRPQRLLTLAAVVAGEIIPAPPVQVVLAL